MEENKLFQEIEPLIEEYIKYSKQEMPDLFFDSRITARMERLNKQYSQDKEGDLLRRLDDEEVGRSVDARRALIEELTRVREENKQARREVIYNKVKEFVNNSIEQMNKEIEEKREKEIEGKIKKEIEEKTKELEEAEQKRKASFKERMNAYKVRKMLLKEVGNESKIYKLADEEAKEKLEKNKEDIKRCETLKQELQEKNIELQEKEQEVLGMEQDLQYFKDKYDDIDFLSEHGIYTLLDLIGLEKEQEMVRMADGRVFDGQEEVSDMGIIMDMQEEAKKTLLPETINADDIIEIKLQNKTKLEKFFNEQYLQYKYPDIIFERCDILLEMEKNDLFSILYERIEQESIGIQSQIKQGELEEVQKRFEEFKRFDEVAICEYLKDIFREKQEIVKNEGEPISNESIIVLKQMYVVLEELGLTIDVDKSFLEKTEADKLQDLSNEMDVAKLEKKNELVLFFAKNYCGKDIAKDEVALIYGEVRDNELFMEAYLEILMQAGFVEEKLKFGYNQFLEKEIEQFKNIEIMEMLKNVLKMEKERVEGLGDQATEDDIIKLMRMEETLKKMEQTLNPKKDKRQGTKTAKTGTRTSSQNRGQNNDGKKDIKPSNQGQQQENKVNLKMKNIVVDLKNDVVEIEIDGKPKFLIPYTTALMQEGERVKEQFLKGAGLLEKRNIKKSDSIILGALKELGNWLKDEKIDEYKDIYQNIDVLNSNYMKNFTSYVKDTDSVKYIFGHKDEMDYSDKTLKQIKKLAKTAQDMGLAEIEGLEENNFIDMAKQFFGGMFKKPKLALQSGIDKAKSIKMPKKLEKGTKFVGKKIEALKEKASNAKQKVSEKISKKPRENLGLEHIEINHEQALERVTGEIVTKEEMEAKKAYNHDKEQVID